MIIEFLISFLSEFWVVLCEMSPYLILGFFIAGVLSIMVTPDFVTRHLGDRKLWSIVKATILGVPLPLCSCGVIPVSASLRRNGAGRGATTAFLISTPQTGVDSIMVTYSLLGPVFAIFRPIAALITGIIGGIITTLVEKNGLIKNTPAEKNNEKLLDNSVSNKIKHVFEYGFISLPKDISKTLMIGLVVAGLISSLIPDDFFIGIFSAGIVAMLLMMIAGIPIYVCATASVPIAAALIMKGVSPGVALVFLLTGPATNAATISTIWKIMGKWTVAVYLLTVSISALLSGIFVDYIFSINIVPDYIISHSMTIGLLGHISAIALLLILGFAMVYKEPSSCGCQETPDSDGIDTKILYVDGMRCSHCKIAVCDSILKLSGVNSVDVNLDSGRVEIKGTDYDMKVAIDAVEALGYKTKKKIT